MIGTVHTWETYTLEQRRRAEAESGLKVPQLPGPYRVAVLDGWCEDTLDVLADAVQRRGGVVQGDGKTRVVATGLGTYWQALQALGKVMLRRSVVGWLRRWSRR